MEMQKIKVAHFFNCFNVFLIEAQEYTLSLRSCFSINFAFLVLSRKHNAFLNPPPLSFLNLTAFYLISAFSARCGGRGLGLEVRHAGGQGCALPGSRALGGSPASLRLSFLLKKWRLRSPPCRAGPKIPRKIQSMPAMCQARSRCSIHGDDSITVKVPLAPFTL